MQTSYVGDVDVSKISSGQNLSKVEDIYTDVEQGINLRLSRSKGPCTDGSFLRRGSKSRRKFLLCVYSFTLFPRVTKSKTARGSTTTSRVLRDATCLKEKASGADLRL